jgi:hypothetical protein
MDAPAKGRPPSQSPRTPEPDASVRDKQDRTLRRDDPLDDRERLDRMDSPLSRLATSAKKDDDRLGHRSRRKSPFSQRMSSYGDDDDDDGDHGFRNMSGDGSLASASSLSSEVRGSAAVSRDRLLEVDAVSGRRSVGEPGESGSSGSPLVSRAWVLDLGPPGSALRRTAQSLMTCRLGAAACGSAWGLPARTDRR